MPDFFPSRAEFRAGIRAAAQRRRQREAQESARYGYQMSIPQSQLPADVRAELDALGKRLVAAQPRGRPQSEEAKDKLRIRYS